MPSELHKELLDSLHQVVFEIDLSGKLTYANLKGLEMFGITKAAFEQGIYAIDFIAPEDRGQAAFFISKMLKEQGRFQNEYKALRQDGSNFPALINATSIIRDNRIIGIRGFIVDLTERKQLEEFSKRYHLLSEHARDIIMFVRDKDSLILEVNTAAENAYGFTRQELLSMKVSDLCPDQSGHEPLMYAAHQNRHLTETVHRRRDGRTFPVEVSCGHTVISGESVHLLIIRDISERKHLENSRKQLISDISHDLRTPMTLIQGYIEAITEGVAPSAEDQKKYLTLIRDKIVGLNQLTQELFRSSELDIKRPKLNLTQLPVDELITRICKVYKLDIEASGLDCEIHCSPPTPWVNVDIEKIDRVFSNLIFNAIKFTPRGGLISISYKVLADHEVMIEVRDNGPGISEDSLPYIFQRFYSGSEPHNRVVSGGSGLGLSITKEVIELHGGWIWAESKPGTGSAFRFTLPLAGAAS